MMVWFSCHTLLLNSEVACLLLSYLNFVLSQRVWNNSTSSFKLFSLVSSHKMEHGSVDSSMSFFSINLIISNVTLFFIIEGIHSCKDVHLFH